MTEVQRPATRADLEALPYGDKQSLAADLGFGRIVGVKEKELENYIGSELFDEPVDDVVDEDDPADPQADDAENADSPPEPDSDVPTERDTTRMDDSDTESDSSEHQTDAVEVGHQGKEKLAPEGAPDDAGTAVEPPDGQEWLADAKPSDLEAGAEPDDVVDAGASETASDPAPADQRENSGDAGKPAKEESSGLLSRIKGDSEDQRTSEEIVEDADSEEERERRREMKARLEQGMAGADAGDVDQEENADASGDPASSATTSSTTKASGMLVDQDVVGHMIAMPFNFASSATGWDGWELSAQERAANAELFVAMCDEQDIDVGPTTMFALSMGGTFGGKAMRYKKQKGSSESAGDVEAGTDRTTADVQDDRGADRRERDDRRDDQGGDPPRQQPRTPAVDGGQESSEDSEFDFNDSSTW